MMLRRKTWGGEGRGKGYETMNKGKYCGRFAHKAYKHIIALVVFVLFVSKKANRIVILIYINQSCEMLVHNGMLYQRRKFFQYQTCVELGR